jgi:apolipoprotein N-acyltransferase
LPVTFDNPGRWLAAFLGLLLPLCFAPFHFYFLAPVMLAALFGSWFGQSAREAAWRGFIFGLAGFIAGTYWLYISIHVFGDAPRWLAVLLMLSLVGVMAAYIAICGWLAARLRGHSVWLSLCLIWPACWTLVEWLRGWLFSGFPWLSLGYGQIDGPLGSWAPVLGVYGVSFVLAMLSGAMVAALIGRGRDRMFGVLFIVVIVGSTAAIHDRSWTDPMDRELNVSLIQGSISQDRKWLREQREPTMELYRSLTFELENQDLIIWPEAAVPAVAYQVVDYLDALQDEARQRDVQLLLGLLTFDFSTEQYGNTLLALGQSNGSYQKRHLVPFGEFFPVPAFIRSWLRLMSLPYSDAAPGPRDQPPLMVGDVALAPSICYEDAFGSEQLDFLPEAGLLVNVSNDAWFGDSIAPHQHLQIAQMRSLETGRPMLRTTNTGVTAIIAANGQILQQSPQFETHVLSGIVRPYQGMTPFVRTGNYPVIVTCFFLVGLGWVIRRRQATISPE